MQYLVLGDVTMHQLHISGDGQYIRLHDATLEQRALVKEFLVSRELTYNPATQLFTIGGCTFVGKKCIIAWFDGYQKRPTLHFNNMDLRLFYPAVPRQVTGMHVYPADIGTPLVKRSEDACYPDELIEDPDVVAASGLNKMNFVKSPAVWDGATIDPVVMQLAQHYHTLLSVAIDTKAVALNDVRLGENTSPKHLQWMLTEIQVNHDQELTKKHRWLGFIQGLMVAHGITTVPLERDYTRNILNGQ